MAIAAEQGICKVTLSQSDNLGPVFPLKSQEGKRFWSCSIWEKILALTVAVRVCSGCHNEVPQPAYLKTTHIYSLMLSEARSPRSRCWQGHVPSEGSREEFYLASSWHLGGRCSTWVFLDLQPHQSHLCICPHMFFSLLLFLFPDDLLS